MKLKVKQMRHMWQIDPAHGGDPRCLRRGCSARKVDGRETQPCRRKLIRRA